MLVYLYVRGDQGNKKRIRPSYLGEAPYLDVCSSLKADKNSFDHEENMSFPPPPARTTSMLKCWYGSLRPEQEVWHPKMKSPNETWTRSLVSYTAIFPWHLPSPDCIPLYGYTMSKNFF